jgi:UDP-N-acetyl-2-amino-2-deoxyglucuronate dehydrogenase
MTKLNYGLIGCGAAGKVHAYYFSKAFNLKSLSDTNPESLDLFTSLFNPETTYFNDKEMLTKEGLDVVSIATPPYFHREQVLKAASEKIHILCEKPLAATLQDAQSIVDACKSSGVTLGIMLPRRFYNNSQAVKKILDSDDLGKITDVSFVLECHKEREYYSTWRGQKKFTGGGILMSQAIHSIDQLVYFFGNPLRVKGNVRTTRDYLEVEDEADAVIEFASGESVTLKTTANSEKTWKGITSITGEKGKIILDSAETLMWDVPNVEKPLLEEKESISTEFKPKYYGPGHMKVIEDFISSIGKGERPYVTGEDCLDAMKIIFGIYGSSAKGGEWVNL